MDLHPDQTIDSCILILDVVPPGQRQLDESVRACELHVRRAESFEDLLELLRQQAGRIAVLAYEALWPDPQQSLRQLREVGGGARLVVAYAENSPRYRLGQRLWGAGLLDYFIPRAMPPHELRVILRQALAEAFDAPAAEPAGPESSGSVDVSVDLALLEGICAALTHQSHVEGVLRELHMRLQRLLSYSVLEVLVCEPGAAAHNLHVFQTVPVEYQIIWQLAEQVCAASTPFAGGPLEPAALTFVESSPPTSAALDANPPVEPAPTMLGLPILQRGELVACLGIATAAPSAAQQTLLRLIAHQLGSVLRNAYAAAAAERVSLIDELTGAHNHRYLQQALDAEWRRAQRYDLHLTVAVIAIDHFRRINDLHGHLVGDQVLRNLSALLRRQMRETDHLVRHGGDCFLLLLPETGPSEAVLVLERIRAELRQRPIHGSESGKLQIAISGGLATAPICKAPTAEALIEMAQDALALARSTGRDRLCLAGRDAAPTVSGSIAVRAQGEQRRFPRIASQLAIRYLALPRLSRPIAQMQAFNLSPGGLGVHGPSELLVEGTHALVYIEGDQKPVLAQVAWARDEPGAERSAGLRFLRGGEVGGLLGDGSLAQPGRPRALVIAERPTTIDLATRVLRAAHYDCHVLDSPPTPGSLTLQGYPLVLVGESSLRRAELVEELRAGRGDPVTPRIVLLHEGAVAQEALELAHRVEANHLVGTHLAEEVLFATLNKLVAHEYFGVHGYLTHGATTHSWTIERAEQKAAVLAAVTELAQEVCCQPRTADLLVAAVEEIMIAALQLGTAAERAAGRVTIEAGCDGRVLGVSVLDRRGDLTREEVHRRLGITLQRDGGRHRELDARQGLSLRLPLQSLSHLALAIEPQRRMEIIGLIDVRRPLRELRAGTPGFGIFVREQ